MKQHFALFAAVVFPHTRDKTAATTMTIPDSANSKPFSLNDALAEKFSHIIATGNWQPALPVLDADYESGKVAVFRKPSLPRSPGSSFAASKCTSSE